MRVGANRIKGNETARTDPARRDSCEINCIAMDALITELLTNHTGRSTPLAHGFTQKTPQGEN